MATKVLSSLHCVLMLLLLTLVNHIAKHLIPLSISKSDINFQPTNCATSHWKLPALVVISEVIGHFAILIKITIRGDILVNYVSSPVVFHAINIVQQYSVSNSFDNSRFNAHIMLNTTSALQDPLVAHVAMTELSSNVAQKKRLILWLIGKHRILPSV